MNKIRKIVKNDLWIVLLDIVAVNLSYFLTLLIRYYSDYKLRLTALYTYLPGFARFAPFYTFICIGIFFLFRLYGGMWKFAGINDMNRLVLANLVTTVIYVVGTIAFICPMPKSYYILGAILQFVFLVIIRFSPRIIAIERQKIAMRNTPSVNVIVVGLGDIGQQVIHQIRVNKVLKPVCYLDVSAKSEGLQYDGIPIISDIEEIDDVIDQNNVQIVFIADQQLDMKQRRTLKEICLKRKAEIQDYTGYLSNIDDAASLSGVLNTIKGPVTISLYGEETAYENGNQALKELSDSYTIESISCKDDCIVIEIRSNKQVVFILKDDSTEAYVGYDKWEHGEKEEVDQ